MSIDPSIPEIKSEEASTEEVDDRFVSVEKDLVRVPKNYYLVPTLYKDQVPDKRIPATPKVTSPDEIQKWLESQLPTMDHPYAYLGDEPNTWKKDWDGNDFKMCLVGAMSYASSEGNLAIPLIYSQMNHGRPEYVTERTYFPNSRAEIKKFVDDGVPFFSLESKRPLGDFDVLAFSVSYIMPYLHIPLMLHLSGINCWAWDRKEDDPIVVVGGCMSFVSEIIAGGRGGIPDIIYVGESEDCWLDLVDDIRDWKLGKYEFKCGNYESRGKYEFLLDVQRKYSRGVYVPRLYDVEYYADSKEIASRIELEGRIPKRIKKAYQKNMNEGNYFLTDPFISFAGGMAMGHFEIARGCSNHCNFCQEGWTYSPYRERDPDLSVEKMAELMWNTGSVDVVPASFTSSDHHHINYIIKRLMEEVTADVSIISQRADAFSADPAFAQLTGLGGSHTVSIGMEGISQRMRDVMSKGVTEQSLLSSIEYALKAGYTGIKLFMITNVPGASNEDYEEMLEFLDKVNLIREKYNPSSEIKLSFTPLFMSGHTPFQWHAVTVEERSLTPWIKEIKKRGFGFRLGSGARQEESWLSQLFHLADRRITDILVRAAIDDGYVHYGSTSKGTIEKWKGYLAEKDLSFEFFFKEKHEDWIFPWDHLDMLFTKDSLWKEYLLSRQSVGRSIPCVNNACYRCGACDKDIWCQRKGWRNKKKQDGVLIDPQQIQVIRQKGTVQTVRLRVEIDALHRFVERDHWRLQFRRACYLLKIPLSKKGISFASDRIKMFNWISGVDYVDIQLIEHTWDKSVFTSDNFNNLLRGCRVTNAHIYNDMKRAAMLQDLCLYEIKTDETINTIDEKISWFLNQPECSDVIDNTLDRKAKSVFKKKWPTVGVIKTMGFRGLERVMVDFRKLVQDIWKVERDGQLYLRMTIRGVLSPYDLYQMLFKKKWKSSIGMPAQRLEYLVASDGDQDDFMVDRCEVCDAQIEQNIFGDPVDDMYCLRHQPVL